MKHAVVRSMSLLFVAGLLTACPSEADLGQKGRACDYDEQCARPLVCVCVPRGSPVKAHALAGISNCFLSWMAFGVADFKTPRCIHARDVAVMLRAHAHEFPSAAGQTQLGARAVGGRPLAGRGVEDFQRRGAGERDGAGEFVVEIHDHGVRRLFAGTEAAEHHSLDALGRSVGYVGDGRVEVER